MMTKNGPDDFSAEKPDTIEFIVESVNMVNNADLDAALNPTTVNNFKKTGKFTMDSADQTIVISYGFPTNVPGAKYTRTIIGPGLTDGPFDVTKPAGETRSDLSYEFTFVAAAGAGQVQP